ncbi:hypothetical protein E2P81_ATG03565 [Venturia nashicola]|uniref:Major facilitator superfamily (MFS) profile domain-containing protein n=1 Tax=Venturia nashicola TaxID=86259 RepID=A0A4Z1P927_9PEZI|nr:hypothetical protein E6O75_ATG03640 [Venturia nashicola]TLD37890.1 hypothetical protein E2P81_ATG03565 [Venturia nashicola]
MDKAITYAKNRIKYTTSEQRLPLTMRDQISRDEELEGAELHQYTSSKDWAMQHQRDHSLPPTSQVEVVQRSMGKQGRLLIWIGLALMLIIYQFDNALLFNYSNYATSSYKKVSALGALGTASGIIFAVAKPPIAKLSDVIGRGETYALLVSFMVLSYILEASSKTFNTYAAGSIIHTFGQTGVNVMNDIIISDFTEMRWRSFAIGISFFPFLITPWISAFIVESVIGGIGWRWGIGMFAILMPACAVPLVGALLFYQRRCKTASRKWEHKTISFYRFCSQLDLGGVFLLVAGSAMFLLPFSLSSTTPKKWKTPWVIALIVVGSLTLSCLVFYESRMAKNPILPPKYLRNTSIVLCCLLGAFDSFAFSSTHAYFYSWLTITHDFGPRNATFVTYVNGVFSCLAGIIGGLVVSRFRRYKWLIVGGAIVKLLGYGLMLRVRGAKNSTAELVIVQALQGMGSGLLDITIIVVAQIQVPRIEMAQVTALVLLCTFLGSSVGSAVAGGIYTGTFKESLRKYLGTGSAKLVDSVFDSITGKVPAPGTFQRNAINRAYSDVLRFITYSALATSIVVLGLAVILPSFRLRDGHNLVEGTDSETELQYHGGRETSTDDRDGK